MRITALAVLLALSVPASAQEQQAGNEASANADETFQNLIAQCDDTDALTLRARIRLLLSRTTEEAAAEAQSLLDQGFAKCGEGEMEEAMTTLNNALSVAEKGLDEAFDTASAEDTTPATASADADAESEDKPWWKFW